MSNLPPLMAGLGLLKELDGVVQVGRGVAGAVLDETYNVFRMDRTTQGSQSANPPINFGGAVGVNYPAFMRRTTKKLDIENETYSLLCYAGTCDARYLVLGDLLYQQGTGKTGADYFYFAEHRPMRPNLFMSAPFTATITRPYPHAGNANQQPETGFVTLEGYGGIDKQNEEVLVLQNGFHSFQHTAIVEPARVQVGMQPIRRLRDGHSLGTPTDMFRVEYLFYCPETVGEQLNELDRFNLGSADRYEIAQIYSSEWTGLSGIICVCEKSGV